MGVERVLGGERVLSGERVLGVDACRLGWIGVALTIGVALAEDRVDAYFAPTIEDLVATAEADGRVLVVGIDMPIGLPDAGPRRADEIARGKVGPLRSSVFLTPARSALEAADHRTASARNRELAGSGISIQAFSLKPKIVEVERWVRRTDRRVVEVHPEVSFAHLAGRPLVTRKSTWAGAEQRRGLLVGAGITLAADLGTAGRFAAVDDVLDAAVVAWTARRVLRGEASCWPDPPELFSDGLSGAIWC